MQQYHEQINTAASTHTAFPAASRSRSDPVEPSIERLMDTYGLDDKDRVNWSDLVSDTQSVGQEFQAYITEPQSNHTDILHYWKVSLRVQFLFTQS